MLRTKLIVVLALTLRLSISTAMGREPSRDGSAVQFGQWGAETLAAIDRDLRMADRELYAEKVTLGDQPSQPAFMWGAGVQLSALAAAAKFDSVQYVPPLVEYADSLKSYWVERHGIGGYDVLPSRTASDRFYDDNAWIVLALVETYNATGDRRYLDRAVLTYQFVLSGEDESLGGGVYWQENTRQSKNTCANAPTVVAALLLFLETNDPKYLADAERINEWTRYRLQDRDDGLYWDSIQPGGRVDRRKFSYNSAVMVRANCLFYEVKGDPMYLAEAERIARSAAARWIEPDTGAVKDSGRFAHMLLESLLALDELAKGASWQSTVYNCLAFVRLSVRDPMGHYPGGWDAPPASAIKTIHLIDQASAARAYFAAANFHRRQLSPVERANAPADAAKPSGE